MKNVTTMSIPRWPGIWMQMVMLWLVGPGSACSEEDRPSPSVTLVVEQAMASRCNQDLTYHDVTLDFTLTNTGAEDVLLGEVALVADEDFATGELLVSGTTGFESGPIVLAAGQNMRFDCSPDDALLAWPSSQAGAAGHRMTVTVTFSGQQTQRSGTVSGQGPLLFGEAFDSCDTFGGVPHACRASTL